MYTYWSMLPVALRYSSFFILCILCFTPSLAAADALVKTAMELAGRGRYTEARAAARSSGSDAAIAAVQWYELTRSPDIPEFSAYEQFLTRHPGWPNESKLLLRAELALLANPASDGMIASWFKRHAPQTAYGRYLNALLTAQPITDTLITDTWIHGDFTQADERKFYNRYKNKLTRDLHTRRADRLIWEGRYAAAQRLFPYLDDGHLKLFDARIKLAAKARNVDGLVDRVPASLKNDPGLIYERLRWRAYKKNYAGVEELLLMAPATVPYPEKWWPYRQRAIREALDARRFDVAYRLASAHGQRERFERSEALWSKGWIALVFRHSAEEALRDFSEMYGIVSYPISRSRAAYWAGRAAKAAGKGDATGWFKKAAEHATTFYGQLALLEISPTSAISIPWPATPHPADAATALQKTDLGRTVLALGQADALDSAWPFLLQLIERAGSESNARALVMTGYYFKRIDVSLKAAKEAQRFGWNFTEAAFPVPTHYRIRHGIETPYALAISRQESLFNERATSPAGARGLMQVMPATGRAVASRHKLPHSNDQLFNAEHNIMIGSLYLQGLLENFRGNYVLATAGYNAGPGRPIQWQARNGRLGNDLYQTINWIEMIPFNETRNYVQRVLENQQVYRYLLSQGKQPVTLGAVLTGR